jgi:hypothetical protein
MPSGQINFRGLLVGGASSCQSERSSPSALAIRGIQSDTSVGQAIVPAGGLQAAVGTKQTTHTIHRGHGAAKLQKFASKQRGGLKRACSQDWLPHKNARLQWQAEEVVAKLPYRTAPSRSRLSKFCPLSECFQSRARKPAVTSNIATPSEAYPTKSPWRSPW